MRYLWSVLAFFITFNTYSQEGSVVLPDSISFYVKIDQDEFIQRAIPTYLPYREKTRLKKERIYFNRSLIDSTGLSFSEVKYVNGALVGRHGNGLYKIGKQGVERINLSIGSERIIEDIDSYFLVGIAGTAVYELNPNTLQKDFLFDMKNSVCTTPPCYGFDNREDINSIFSIHANSLFIQTCVTDDNSPECGFIGYYIYDRKNNQIENITERVKKYIDPKCKETERSEVFIKSNDGQFLRAYTEKISDYCTADIDKSWLADATLNYNGDLLCLGEKYFGINPPAIGGFTIQNNAIDSYYFFSKLDNGKQVIVPYKFLPNLEKSMLKAYSNGNIERDEIIGLGKDELAILRNLIFAKHNYDFDSDFYKAYFNLYCFYNTDEMRSSRTKDINNKLTDNDKKNLNLIKSLEGK